MFIMRERIRELNPLTNNIFFYIHQCYLQFFCSLFVFSIVYILRQSCNDKNLSKKYYFLFYFIVLSQIKSKKYTNILFWPMFFFCFSLLFINFLFLRFSFLFNLTYYLIKISYVLWLVLKGYFFECFSTLLFCNLLILPLFLIFVLNFTSNFIYHVFLHA